MILEIKINNKVLFKMFSTKSRNENKIVNFEDSLTQLYEDANILYGDIAEEVNLTIESIKHNGIIDKYNFTIVKAKKRC